MALQLWVTRCMKSKAERKIQCFSDLLVCHWRHSAMVVDCWRLTMHLFSSYPANRVHNLSKKAAPAIPGDRCVSLKPLRLYSKCSTCYCSSKIADSGIMSVNEKEKTESVKSVPDSTSSNKQQQGDDTDSEDIHLKPLLDSIKPSVPPPLHVDIVPGKGPPPEPPVDCCMSGCANCVWIQYAEELKQYFSKDVGLERAKADIEKIDNPGLKMFIKMELGMLR